MVNNAGPKIIGGLFLLVEAYSITIENDGTQSCLGHCCVYCVGDTDLFHTLNVTTLCNEHRVKKKGNTIDGFFSYTTDIIYYDNAEKHINDIDPVQFADHLRLDSNEKKKK